MPVDRAVWRISRAGSLDRLAIGREPLAEPGPGEARVRVDAVGLNFADLFACQGLYSATPPGSFIPGLECVGVIEAFGSDESAATGLQIGDRVVALTRFGAYATAINTGLAYLQRVPAGWSSIQAAAWPVQGLTALYGLVTLGGVEAADTVLVQSAAGGVGLQALEILDSLGARPLAVVGHESKRRFLIDQRGLGPEAVIVRDRRHFARQLDSGLAGLGATGFDCVLDAVLGPGFHLSFERLRPEGRYVLFGAADFMSAAARPNYLRLALDYLRRPRLDPLAMISDNRSLMAFNLIWLWNHAERLPEAYRQLEARQRRRPHVGAVFPFERAPEALRLLQAGGTIGKVVLQVQPDAASCSR